ncbi:MAG: polymer-forming cytoskeletal protein [Acidimicrobiia bacterium]|nr:polymer-forming cytoskeletal protein [Acidimicrobiia bacterium]
MSLHRFRNFAAASVLGVLTLGLALPFVVADFITTGIYLVQEGEVEDGDVYLAANSARILGTIDGDLIVSTGSLTISGEVTGDVLFISQGTVRVEGEVGGSLRGAAREVLVEGTVGHDVAVATTATRITGTVSRDALVFAGTMRIDGEVAGDVNGRMIRANIDGDVGNDVDVAVGNLTLGPNASIAGDLIYRSGSDADIAGTASVGSQVARLPTRGSFAVEIILTIATILGFFAFLFAGLVMLWLFRSTAPRAVAAVEKRPLRTTAIGVAAIIILPLGVLLLLLTLVGAPVAIAVALLMVLGLVFGPVPAVTALGSWILRSRQLGLLASFLLGAIIWRAGIWLIPFVGALLYLAALAAGVGGWLVAIWERRKETPLDTDLLPRRTADVIAGDIPSPIDWDAPLAPGSRRSVEEEDPPTEPEAAD